MREGFRTFDHTGDLGLEVFAPSPARLFELAAEGLMAQVAECGEAGGDRREAVLEVEAADPEALLVDWLNAVLLESELRRAVWTHARVLEWSPRRLRASLGGPARDPRHMVYLREIKAVSHHALELALEPPECRARVVLDI